MSAHVRIDALRHLGRVGSVLVLCLLLSACSLGGDDEDPDPTATSEPELESLPTQTAQATLEPTETRAAFRLIPSSPESTAEPSDDAGTPAESGTPERSEPTETTASETSPEATPEDDSTVEPTDTPEAPAEADATPELPANSVTGSDGTSGPTGVAGLLEESNASPQATPEQTSSENEVEGCDVVEAPPFRGDSADYVVAEEVNFRVGPGADCDPVLDAPLEVGTSLTVLSEPVIRSDDDEEIEWVQVQVDDEIGWVAEEFIEPAE